MATMSILSNTGKLIIIIWNMNSGDIEGSTQYNNSRLDFIESLRVNGSCKKSHGPYCRLNHYSDSE